MPSLRDSDRISHRTRLLRAGLRLFRPAGCNSRANLRSLFQHIFSGSSFVTASEAWCFHRYEVRADQLGFVVGFVLLAVERLRYSPLRFTFNPQPQFPFCSTVAEFFRNVTRTAQFLSSEGW